jgi:3,4-dihydroxy 2-butanone 4-phosphate synthase/GTP cyclohydrolase II
MNAPFEVMHPDPLTRVELAMEDLRAGRAVIMVDDEDRENEGDIVYAAEKITPEAINFMAVHARGLICLSITASQVERLGLSMMATQNQSPYNTAFTTSIEAREGVTTGISAVDRALTVQVAIKPDASRKDIVTPGHMFPLRARDGGVLERVGQTEGSVDLARLAGLNASAVICEIMNADGTMARMPDLVEFGMQHRLRIVGVADIIKHRMQNERIVQRVHQGELAIEGLGSWQVTLYRGLTTEGLHMALSRGDLSSGAPIVRVQGAPPAWAFLASDISAVAGSARTALTRIHAEGRGALVLMHLGGKTQDLLENSFQRDFGGPSEAFSQPKAEALRDLGTGCQILRDLGVTSLKVLTSTGRPVVGLEAYGLELVESLALSV